MGDPAVSTIVPMFCLHTTHCLSIFDLAGSAASGRHSVLHLVAKYLKVSGVKGWQGLKIQALCIKCKYVIGLHTLMLFTDFYPSLINDIEQLVVCELASDSCISSNFRDVFL